MFKSIIVDYVKLIMKPRIILKQHGFSSGSSTESNLTIYTNFTMQGFEEGVQVDVICTDFSKAFDSVNIDLLLHKIQVFGISNVPAEWFESYLRDRSQ